MSIDTHAIKRTVRGELSRAFLTWRRHLQRQLAPLGVTLKQGYVLRQLAQHDFRLPSQIADELYCDRPTATVVIRNMEKQGWVRRERDDQDRRRMRIILTVEGRQKLDQLSASGWREMDHRFDPLDCFAEDELDDLRHLLTKLNGNLRQLTQEDASDKKE